MLAIRLTRTGKIHNPHYRIVVQEKRSKLNGKALEIIGHYHPAQADKLVVINKERAAHWLKMGAQASDTVTNLFVKEGLLDASKKVHFFFTPTKKEEKPADVVAEAPVAEEASAEEAVAESTEEVSEEAPATEEVVVEPEIKEEATK